MVDTCWEVQTWMRTKKIQMKARQIRIFGIWLGGHQKTPLALQSWSLTVFWKAQGSNTFSVTIPHHGSCLFQAVRGLQCFISCGAQHSLLCQLVRSWCAFIEDPSLKKSLVDRERSHAFVVVLFDFIECPTSDLLPFSYFQTGKQSVFSRSVS